MSLRRLFCRHRAARRSSCPLADLRWATRFRAVLAGIGLAISCCIARAEDSERFFETKIRPILVETCLPCHSDLKKSGGLRLDSLDALLQGGASGPAIIAGRPDESLLIRAIQRQQDVSAMPPEQARALRPEQVADFVNWIKAGAEWPAVAARLEAANHWAFAPLIDVAAPDVHDGAWLTSDIDHYIRSGQEVRHLNPAPAADRRALLRRVTFDLTGLPPTLTEMQEYLHNETPDAIAQVVDRLLASPAHGERWGRHWLDVVRYADARDLIQLPAESDFREVWRYRDWVVQAFNRDLPYDDFVTRQLAGDLLQPSDSTRIDAESLVATGMLAIADFVPGDVDKKQMIADYVNDEIDLVGRAFLGLTLACARCHDHKFDPISTEDYYAMAGIFFSTRVIPSPSAGNTPLVRAPLLAAAEIQAINQQAQRDKERIAELTQIVQSAADREFRLYLERRLNSSLSHDLPVAVAYLQAMREPIPPTLDDFAAKHQLDAATLERWVQFFHQQPSPAALSTLLTEADRAAGAQRVAEVLKQLTLVAAERRERIARDSVAELLATSELLRFRSDDRLIAIDAAGKVTRWPDRASLAADAAPPADTRGPMLAMADIRGHSRPVLRFDGEAVLQAPRAVPPAGTLFIVFRTDPNAPSGTRIVGWEDSAAGQHGIGLMPDSAGGLHAILRRAGANGDIVAPAPAESGFQLITLTWGAEGAALFRDGVQIGVNKSIDAVTSDPAIAALRIGGPGSGSAQRFRGDLCELRIYGSPLNEAARVRVETEICARWFERTEDRSLAASDAHPEASSVSAEIGFHDLYDELLSPRSPYWIGVEDRTSILAQDVRDRLVAQRDELESLKKKPAAVIPQAVVVQDGGPVGSPFEGFHDAQVFLRGNPSTPGKTVPRGFPQVLAGPDPAPITEGSGRRELARWLTRPNHPLTARVMVNRIWQHHFGEGLVRTSTNFGLRGEPPSHPELLDRLARRFIDSGWSIKSMHRRIVLTRVYQQGSFGSDASRATDPDNRWLARMPRRRLEAEAIRDSLLGVSGLLDTMPGGPGFLEVGVPRRTLYLMSVRTGSKTADFPSLFDGPAGGIVERRNQSIVAPQALYLLNDPLLDDVSASLAARVTREVPSSDNDERINYLYRLALGREPTATEIAIGRQLIVDPDVQHPWTRYCRLILCTNEFIYVD